MAMSTTIALYATSPTTMCSTPHPCQISAYTPYDFELSSRSSSTPSSSSSQKPVLGGLSCLLSSASRHSSTSSGFSCGGEELGSLWHDRGEESKELKNTFRFSPSKSVVSSMSREQSPVTVFQGPLSRSSNGVGSSAKTPSMWISGDRSGDFNFLGSIRGGTNGLFKGFLSNAVGSCVDHDSTSFKVDNYDMNVGSSPVIADELTFNMDDTSVESDYEPYAKDLLLIAQLRHTIFCDDFVIKAFYEAEKSHRGQMRASGDPYLQHCVETAILLASIGANSTVVAAGLLHDTVDDSFMTYDHIFGTFGAEVADLVKGVSKLSHLSKLARDNNTADRTAEADRLHTMFLAMADARAVLIKLADRLHNMMTLDALPLSKQKRFAKETLEIFVPLTNRLGISTWKEQMENLCFKHLNPDQHIDLSSKLVELFDEAMISSAAEKLKQALEDQGIFYHALSGRHKSVYSLHSKMLKKRLTMDEIHDIHGLRLILEEEEDCYKALRVVHQLWPKVPGKLKDYISQPKFNGYQSIHTVVTGEGGITLEVQIRTKEMHLHAELGFASHWRYKEGDCKHSSFVLRMVEWARWVLTWHCETLSKDHSAIAYTDSVRPLCKFPSHSNDCPFSYNPLCCQDGPLFVIIIDNFKMSVQELPANSTVVDAIEGSVQGRNRLRAYGFPSKEELRPKVNNEVVSNPNWKLKMGDVVELSPPIPDMSLTECREEIQRMYDRGLTLSTQPLAAAANTVVGFRS